MLLSGRPLYDNRADGELFVIPPRWDEVVNGIDRGLNVLIAGRRGSGKTSLLHQIQMTLRHHGERVVFVDGTAAADISELASRARNGLQEGEPSPLALAAETAIGAVSSASEPIASPSRALDATLRAIGEAEATTILLDASSAPEAVYGLFGRMRDVLWQQPHNWVVAIEEGDRPSVLKPPADAFFDLIVDLEWSTQEIATILVRRGPEDEGLGLDQVTKAAAAADGSPREALRALSHAVVNDEDPSAFLEDRAKLLDAASRIGRAPAMLMAELLDREQAGPSDEDLQNSLGVTRARLAQMFSKLQAADLVVAQRQRPSGPGRPRVVYRARWPR
jgi:energy-coupling factor transporter ATP-binding protein EcfA2